MKKMTHRLFRAGIALIGAFALTGCLYGQGVGVPSSLDFQVTLLATNPFPFPYVTSAVIVVDQIEVRDSSGKFNTISLGSNTIDLMKVPAQGGIVLPTLALRDGTYDQVRLSFSSATIDLTDKRHFNFIVTNGGPSPQVTLPLDPAMSASTTKKTDLVLNLDVSRTFQVQGNFATVSGITGFLFNLTLGASSQ